MKNEDKLSIYSYDSYRSFLSDFLALKKRQNSSYSLRSFAVKLKMTPGNLSEVLKGKKNISIKKSSEVAKSLFASAGEAARFLALVQSEQLDGKVITKSAPRKNEPVAKFEIFKKWYYIAVLEMLRSSKYQNKPGLIALDIGISEDQVMEAIRHMDAAGLLENDSLFEAKVDEKSLKKFYFEMLTRAQNSISYQNVNHRYNATETMMVDLSQLQDAQKIINKCLDDLVELFKTGKNRSEIYHVGVQMFSLKSQYGLNKKED